MLRRHPPEFYEFIFLLVVVACLWQVLDALAGWLGALERWLF